MKPNIGRNCLLVIFFVESLHWSKSPSRVNRIKRAVTLSPNEELCMVEVLFSNFSNLLSISHEELTTDKDLIISRLKMPLLYCHMAS